MQITLKTALELISHEAIVREAYRDSTGVWTWSVGITRSSGHRVYPRYKDNPQTIERCLEVFEWLIRTKYGPVVDEVFDGFDISEAQAAAALSFHWHTGGLRVATWAKQWKAGRVAEARVSFMNWCRPPEIIKRRKKERNLFFDGEWRNDGLATVYPVHKPSYRPDFRRGRRVDVRPALQTILGA